MMVFWKLTRMGFHDLQGSLFKSAINPSQKTIAIYCPLSTWIMGNPLTEQKSGSISTNSGKTLLKPRGLPQLIKRNAGHSKWSNIKHVKEAQDKLRSASTTKLFQRMKKVIKDTGSYNPDLNPRLAKIIEDGKKQNVPAVKMNDFLKKLQNTQDKSQTVYFEGRGPGNVMFIFQTMTDRPKQIRNYIQSSYKNHGGKLGEKQIFSSHAFDFKGFVRVAKEEIEDLEKAMDIAIECEAEDVIEVETEDGKTEYEFICDGNEVQKVQSRIGKHNITVNETAEVFLPHNLVTITPEVKKIIDKFYKKIGELEDVSNIFNNINEEED